MTKEQDLRNEILRASPLLDTFLNYHRFDRQEKLTLQTYGKIQELLEFTDGGFVFTVVSSTNVLAALKMTDREAFGNPEHESIFAIGSLIAMGVEIGQIANDGKVLGLFLEEITEKAIQEKLIKPFSFDLAPKYPVTQRVIGALLVNGSTMGHYTFPGLDPLEK